MGDTMIPNKILTVFKTSCIGPLLSLLTVALLEVFARTYFPIPNPPAILLITVVYAASCGGVRPGLLSAAIAWLYFAWFFSIPGEPFHYTHENLLRVLVWAVATPLIAVMAGLLKQRSQRAFELERDNAVLATRIAEREQFAERLVHLAAYDALTGLPNRTLFRDRLTQAMARIDRDEKMLALLLLDMDRFKEINDTFGHDTGDRLLEAVANRLQQGLREVDTIARLGGDEFTMILENIRGADTAATVAKKVVDIFAQPFIVNERELSIMPSIGIALYTRDAQDANTLLRNADIAMYHAKRNGGGNFQFYTEQIHTQTTHRSDLESRLRSALAQGEFTLHYQPQIEIKSGRVVGLEALIRWHNEVLGMVMPDQFIPLAEGSGLIESIGEWVLRTACAQNKAWQEAGLPSLPVAVNLSARQFRQKDLLETILRILQDTGLDPRYLELEITESVIMSQREEAISTLQWLSALGVQISIDDFGSGYSSLAYLKRFAVDRLKINQSFVRDISADPDDMAIVTAIIAMARSLQLKVTAEGVETEEQLSLLGSLDCDDYQGYYFSYPISADKMEKLLRAQAHR